MSRASVVAVAVFTCLCVTTAAAQVCEGRPSRAAGNVALSAAFSSGSDASQFGVGITGLGSAAYGSASVGTISYEDFSGSTTAIGGSLGYQLAVGATGRAQICPYFGVEFGFGPNDIGGTGIDLSARAFSAGLSWGFRALESGDFNMIPSIGAGFVSSSVKLTDGVDELTESDTYGQLHLGLGLVFARRFTIAPSVSIPVGLEGADPTFGIALSLALGKSP